MAKVLKIIGLISIVCGFVAGFFAADEGIVLGLAFVSGGIISGCFFLGFAEVIKLLQALVDKA